ncbi:MAG: hypothetical protein ABUS49_02125 [Acidobacteriota bacterium]
MSYLDRLWWAPSQDWVSGWLGPNQLPAGTPSGEVEDDTAYLNIFLRSARIVNVRRGLTRFYGAVHSYMRVPHRSRETAEFNVVTTPGELKNVDSGHLDRVIQTNERLLGPVPYAGGDLQMQIGLFSIAAADLAAPYLSLLETLSKTAGVSFITAALPFSAPILEGVRLLTGSNKDALEIGLSETQPQPRQGFYVVMRAPKQAVSLSELRMDPADCRLADGDNRPVADFPYMVIEVRATSKRDDWFKIPELGKAYAHVQDAYRENRRKDADAAIDIFRRVALTCNDLITSDAERVAEKVQSMYQEVGPPAPVQRGVSRAGTNILPDLSELQL